MACPHLRHVFPRRDRRQHWGDQPPVLEHEPDQQQCADQLGSSLRQPPVDLVNEYGECGDQVTGAFDSHVRQSRVSPWWISSIAMPGRSQADSVLTSIEPSASCIVFVQFSRRCGSEPIEDVCAGHGAPAGSGASDVARCAVQPNRCTTNTPLSGPPKNELTMTTPHDSSDSTPPCGAFDLGAERRGPAAAHHVADAQQHE